ncbi:hypothetical protein IG197_01720 [Aminobacter sp. SR38]|jgi:hypothetical protein|uniref:hypothetical protein n=1 Tax=Aminobacter sp. SR38 TaxID=2774562 RepID=UPI0017804AF7|nr:hypothetical protein [Aminobacter sp. SR38]QOF71835.1 hypothetical protein IG197_01720 [Aminobacter sp. SR38]
MKPITCVLAADETASWKLIFNMDRRHIYVGTGHPPYKRMSIDDLLAVEPPDRLQRQARDKLMSMMLDAICMLG